MDINLLENSDLYGDSAYLNDEHKELHKEFNKEFNKIRLKAATKKNSLVRNIWAEELENKYYRKAVENTFADMAAKFPKKIMP